MKKLLILTALMVFWIGNETVKANPPQQVSWDTLLNVEWVIKDGNYQITFNDRIKKLDGKHIKIEGYIFPLNRGAGEMEKFLLSANPISGCPYCAPGSSESFIMINSKDKVRFQYESITIEGRFELTRKSKYGIIYKMENVQVIRT